MTKTFKKAAAVVLSAALLTTAAVAIMPSAMADNAASGATSNANLNYAMVQDFNSLTSNSDIDYWQSTNNYHKVMWTITDAKGADSSKAVYVHTAKGASDNGTNEVSINRTLGNGVLGPDTAGSCSTMQFNASDVKSPTEVWIWVDFTANPYPQRFRFIPYAVVNGSTVACLPKDGAPIYFQTATGWKESAFKTYSDGDVYKDLSGVFISGSDLRGFKGYIRMPLTSFDTENMDGTAATVDWSTSEITSLTAATNSGTGLQTAFYFSYDDSGNLVDNGFYLDNILIVGKTAASSVSGLNVPDVSLIETSPTTTTDSTVTTSESAVTTAEPTTTTTQPTTTTTEPTTTTTEPTTTTTQPTTTTTQPTVTTTQPSVSTTQPSASTTAPSESTATTKVTAATTTEATVAIVTEAPTDETTAEETTAAATETTSPKTGESSPVAACALVVFAAASGALLVSKKRK